MRALGLLVLAGCATSAAAPRPVYECRAATGPIALDGRLDEPAWAEAVVVADFRIPGAGPARSATRARLLWTPEALYFAAEMEDVDLFATVVERDGRLWDNDVFELFFKPSTSSLHYYEFQVNAAGALLDMRLPSRGAGGYERFRKAPSPGIEAKAALDGTLNKDVDRDRGWTVEGRIAWEGFEAPKAGDVWRFALCRYDYSTAYESPELSSCAPLTQPSFHRYEDYAELRFRW